MAAIDLIVRRANWKGKDSDLLVSDGRVLELVSSSAAVDGQGAPEVDARGFVLLPSLTDAHTHLREPGFEYKEDIASGLDAAAHGGFGNIMCMANTRPVNDNATVTELMLERSGESWPQGPRLYPIGALTKGLEGLELSPMSELAEAGCVAFSNDGMPVKSTEIFRRAMEYAHNMGRVVIDHCEDPYLEPFAGVNEGDVSGRLGLAAQPDVAEAMQVSRDILLSEYLDIPIHLAHISCRKSVELIAWAKERGVKVTAETCPHYLLLTEDLLAEPETEYQTSLKVNPPLRAKEDMAAVRQALASGVIDMLVTDHAPHAGHEKEVEFNLAPCGISGLDTALALTYPLVAEGLLSLDDLIRAWSVAPCTRFGLPLNRFEPGDPADFVLYDPEAEWTVNPGSMRSKGKNTPFLGRNLKGRVIGHFLGGEKIV